MEQYEISISEAEAFTTMLMDDERENFKERAEHQANFKKT